MVLELEAFGYIEPSRLHRAYRRNRGRRGGRLIRIQLVVDLI